MTKQEFAAAVLACVANTVDATCAQNERLEQAGVRLDNGVLSICFCITDRPSTRYGVRIEAIPEETDWTPAGWAGVVIANWVEWVDAADVVLPCSPGGGVVWLD